MLWLLGALLVAGYTGNLMVEAWRDGNRFGAAVLGVLAIGGVALTAGVSSSSRDPRSRPAQPHGPDSCVCVAIPGRISVTSTSTLTLASRKARSQS